jgi:hypothetical protein
LSIQVDRYPELDLDLARTEFSAKLEVNSDCIYFSSLQHGYTRPGVLDAASLRLQVRSLVSECSEQAARSLDADAISLPEHGDPVAFRSDLKSVASASASLAPMQVS